MTKSPYETKQSPQPWQFNRQQELDDLQIRAMTDPGAAWEAACALDEVDSDGSHGWHEYDRNRFGEIAWRPGMALSPYALASIVTYPFEHRSEVVKQAMRERANPLQLPPSPRV